MRTTSSLAAVLEPELPALADEIIQAIRREVPEYARPMRGEFGRGIRVGVVEALRRFGAGEEPTGVYRALGRGEHRAGRSLDALQSAYRVGARVAWRRLSAVAQAAGVPVAEQHALAEGIFAYIDELAAESVEGYAAAQAEEAGDRQRRREALLALVTAPVPADPGALAAAAAEAAWPLPRRVAALACEPAAAGPLARRLTGDCLHGAGVVVVPEATRLRQEAAAAADRLGLTIGLGPAVPLAEARRSADWAARALALGGPNPAARGFRSPRPGGGAVVVAEERLADLALAAAPDVIAALRERALAPLDAETPRSRARLEETLAAWLGHGGSRAAVAARLGVHEQTVRYRVGRLRELFGDRLDDPDARFELALALR